MMGMELIRLSMDLLVYMDVDMDTGTMKMYMRMPMQISGTDPLSGESLNENVEIAIFMDGSTMFVYESTIGWFTDPSMEVGDLDDMFAGMNLDELIAWSMELNEQIMDQITIRFAADNDQFEGYYVIEQLMDFDDVMNMMGMFLTPDFFEEMLAFIPEEDLADFDQGEWDMVMRELDGMMDEFMAFLDEMNVDIDMQVVYRSYVDVETLYFSSYTMNMTLGFTADVDLGLFGNFDVSGNFTMNINLDYDPTIVWPVIGDVANLDDILEPIADVFEADALVFDANMLEERVEFVPASDTTSLALELVVEYNAGFNIFVDNHGTRSISLVIEEFDVDEVIAPGRCFVMQAPAGSLDGVVVIFIDGAPLNNVEIAFRLTELPLS